MSKSTPAFFDLSSKSCFSFLRGASQPEEMLSTAKRLGYAGLGLTDRNGFYGMVRAFEKSAELELPFVIGCEIDCEGCSLVLIPRNLNAYQRICRLLSFAFQKGDKDSPIFSRDSLSQWLNSEDVLVFLAPRNFPSPEFLLFLRQFSSVHQLVTKKFNPEADHRMKRHLMSLDSEIPRIWTWDAHFHHKSRYELFEVIQGIRQNKTLSSSPPSFNSENELKPLSALRAQHVPIDWIKNSLRIAESCHFNPKEIRYSYPTEWIPDGKNGDEFLRELCEAGIKKRYPQDLPEKLRTQLEHELRLVSELNYADYFLSVWDIVSYARSKNILCQGRGSAANSLICYLLEITSIDPLKMNLLFERFLSKERNEAPDIDVDFEHERREEVIQHIYTKYGRERAGMVATLITYRTRSALRGVGKFLEIPAPKIEDLSHRAKWRENIFDSIDPDPKVQRLLRLAKELKGFPRHLGQHTGGLIISQGRLDEISPIQPARMESRSTVQWDKYDIEKLGLLKIDVLSLGMLTCLRKTFELLKKHQIADLELHRLPQDDPKTYEMICQSKTVGVFQIESRAQMSMLPRLRPKCFYDLVIEVAIIRPGPIQGGMIHPYLRRRMGLERVDYAHPLLKPILEKTLGIPIFQEQVMKIAIEVAGFSPGEADSLRRSMGAWKKKGDLSVFSSKLNTRLRQKGISDEFADRISRQILGFGEYGFPESHAASFALLTYASSYLKAQHPAAFLCALLNSMPLGFYSFDVLSSQFKREGVVFLPLCLEKSDWDHQLEKTARGDWAVRLGFRAVKGLRKLSVDQYVQSRSRHSSAPFYVFDQSERASIKMMTEQDRRSAYWNALSPAPPPFELKDKSISLFRKLSKMENLLLDYEIIGTSLNEHPSTLLKERWNYSVPRSKVSLSSQLSRTPHSSFVFCFGIVQVVQSPPTAKGVFFITLEDETGFINLVMKPEIFKKYKDLIQSQWALLVRGKIQSQGSYASILVHQIYPQDKKAPAFSLPTHTQQEATDFSKPAVQPRLFNR